MCFVKAKKPMRTEGFGWKVFREIEGKLYSTTSAPWTEQRTERKTNIWLKAKPYKTPFTRSGEEYKTGWSIFEKEKDAKRILAYYLGGDTLRKVQYKQATLIGTVSWSNGLDAKTRQANYIKILP